MRPDDPREEDASAARGWGLRTFSWSCFLYGQPLACSVFYRAFPSQRLFDPRMVVPVDVFAGEADGLLARAFLPMPGDARTRPSYGRRTPRPRRCRGCTPSRSWTGPGRAGPSVPAIPATGNDNRGRCGPRDARRAAAWLRPGPGIVSRRFGVRRRPGRVRHDHAVVAVDHRRKVHLSVAGLDPAWCP